MDDIVPELMLTWHHSTSADTVLMEIHYVQLLMSI